MITYTNVLILTNPDNFLWSKQITRRKPTTFGRALSDVPFSHQWARQMMTPPNNNTTLIQCAYFLSTVHHAYRTIKTEHCMES